MPGVADPWGNRIEIVGYEGRCVVAQLSGRIGFARETATAPTHNDNVLLDEPGLKVGCPDPRSRHTRPRLCA